MPSCSRAAAVGRLWYGSDVMAHLEGWKLVIDIVRGLHPDRNHKEHFG